MTLTGHVEDGKIVLDQAVPLTDGIKVRVELLGSEAAITDREKASMDEPVPTFYDRHKAWIGSVKDAPPDYAKNLDHYLYGQPKK